mgnify:CR=1 FL=1
MSTSPHALQIEGLAFGWTKGEALLNIPALTIKAGERVFLEGPSGCGKSTLLSLISGVTPSQGGTLHVLDTDITALSAAKRDAFRANRLGIIFQLFNLVPYLSVIDNILLPCRFSPARAKRAVAERGSIKEAAADLLGRLGLDAVADTKRGAGTLSVGQQQRVAAARALIGAPDFVIADEPTSALDTDTRNAFIDTLLSETERSGAALLFVSHDKGLAPSFDTHLSLPALNQQGAGR